MSHGHYAMDPASMLERVDENTIMVVPTLGVTYTGAYEPVAAMSKALDQLQAGTGLDVGIHVDGASGAFLAPFCAPDVVFDFRLPRVKSISTSGHKFGLAPLGVGWVIWRDRAGTPRRPGVPRQLPGRRHARLPDQLLPPGRADHRPVLQLPAPWPRGLPAHPPGVLCDRPVPRRRDRQAGAIELLCDSDPATGIPTVTWRIRDGADPGYTLFDLADRLRALAAGRCPPTPSPGRRPTSP